MSEIITSRHNPTIVRICKLTEKKNREAEHLFRFDGIKLCTEAIMSGVEFEYIVLRRSGADIITDRIFCLTGKRPQDLCARIILLEDSIFDAISEEKSPEGVISVAKYIDKIHKIVTIDNVFTEFLSNEAKTIILEDIRDPGNLGTIMRTAAALGIDAVFLCGNCADIYNSKTLRGSMGAAFRLPTFSCQDGVSTVKALQKSGRRVMAAALSEDACPITDARLCPKDCIAIGNEGHGLSRDLITACDGSVVIPMRDGNESLNASSAATIFMWEICKER